MGHTGVHKKRVCVLSRLFVFVRKMRITLFQNLRIWPDRSSASNADLQWSAMTFNHASAFTGKGVWQWNTALVTTMYGTFMGASSMNANVGQWDVSKITSMSAAVRGYIYIHGLV